MSSIKDKQLENKEFILEIDRDKEGGVYSNIASVAHNKNEFLIDFGIMLPNRNAARIQSRIITSPVHAKQLIVALKANISKYEETFGEIKLEDINIGMRHANKTVH